MQDPCHIHRHLAGENPRESVGEEGPRTTMGGGSPGESQGRPGRHLFPLPVNTAVSSWGRGGWLQNKTAYLIPWSSARQVFQGILHKGSRCQASAAGPAFQGRVWTRSLQAPGFYSLL